MQMCRLAFMELGCDYGWDMMRFWYSIEVHGIIRHAMDLNLILKSSKISHLFLVHGLISFFKNFF